MCSAFHHVFVRTKKLDLYQAAMCSYSFSILRHPQECVCLPSCSLFHENPEFHRKHLIASTLWIVRQPVKGNDCLPLSSVSKANNSFHNANWTEWIFLRFGFSHMLLAHFYENCQRLPHSPSNCLKLIRHWSVFTVRICFGTEWIRLTVRSSATGTEFSGEEHAPVLTNDARAVR